jgi:hypothetical protein
VVDGHIRFAAGDVVTNLHPPIEPTDKYWPGLSAATLHQGMEPLTPDAIEMKAVSAYANEVMRTWVAGVDSVR